MEIAYIIVAILLFICGVIFVGFVCREDLEEIAPFIAFVLVLSGFWIIIIPAALFCLACFGLAKFGQFLGDKFIK